MSLLFHCNKQTNIGKKNLIKKINFIERIYLICPMKKMRIAQATTGRIRNYTRRDLGNKKKYQLTL